MGEQRETVNEARTGGQILYNVHRHRPPSSSSSLFENVFLNTLADTGMMMMMMMMMMMTMTMTMTMTMMMMMRRRRRRMRRRRKMMRMLTLEEQICHLGTQVFYCSGVK